MKPKNPERLLKRYWHESMDSLKAPPGLAEKAIRAAHRLGPPLPSVRGRGFWRPAVKASVAMGGVMVLVGLGLLLTRSQAPVDQLAGSHVAAQKAASGESVAGAAISGPGSPLALVTQVTRSGPGMLWALDHAQGQWQVWARQGRTWQLRDQVPGPARPKASLAFWNQEGWLVAPKGPGGWTVRTTFDNGVRWTTLRLPSGLKKFNRVAIAPQSRSLTLAFSSSSPGPGLLVRQSGMRFNKVASRDLPAQVLALHLVGTHGVLLAKPGLYRTHNGGRVWSPVMTEFSPARSIGAPNARFTPTANALLTARLQGLASAWQGQAWVVIHDTLWVHDQAGWQWRGRIPKTIHPQSLVILNAKTGYLVSSLGKLWISRDGGRQWRPMHT